MEKALAGLAIGLVVVVIAWFVVDRKVNSDLETQRARWAANGWPVDPLELLPPMKPRLAATPVYAEAMNRLLTWFMPDGGRKEWERAQEVAELWTHLEPNSVERAPLSSDDEDTRFERALSDIEAALLSPDCRVYYVMEGQAPAPQGVSFMLPFYMEHRARREFLQGNRGRTLDHVVGLFAFAGRMREVPTVEFCADSDDCLLLSVRLLQAVAERGALDADWADRIRPWLTRVHPEADWIRALDGDRVLVGETMWTRMREGLEPYQVPIPRDVLGLLYTKLARPWRLMEEEAYFERLDEKRALLIDHPWEKVAAPRIPAHLLMNRTIASSIFSAGQPAPSRALDGEQRLRVRRARDLADIALQLVELQAETGTCPESLAALPDLPCEPPLSQPYSFARTETGFTLGLSDPANDPNGTHTWRVNWSPSR